MADTSRIMREIDRATAPDVMSQERALEFLEELAAEIEGRIDALKDEIGNG